MMSTITAGIKLVKCSLARQNPDISLCPDTVEMRSQWSTTMTCPIRSPLSNSFPLPVQVVTFGRAKCATNYATLVAIFFSTSPMAAETVYLLLRSLLRSAFGCYFLRFPTCVLNIRQGHARLAPGLPECGPVAGKTEIRGVPA